MPQLGLGFPNDELPNLFAQQGMYSPEAAGPLGPWNFPPDPVDYQQMMASTQWAALVSSFQSGLGMPDPLLLGQSYGKGKGKGGFGKGKDQWSKGKGKGAGKDDRKGARAAGAKPQHSRRTTSTT